MAITAKPPASENGISSVPRVALTIEECCESMAVSWKTWHEHIEPHVAVVRLGRAKRVSVVELERFCAEHGERLEDTVR